MIQVSGPPFSAHLPSFLQPSLLKQFQFQRSSPPPQKNLKIVAGYVPGTNKVRNLNGKENNEKK